VTAGARERVLLIEAIPAFSNRTNPYNELLYRALQAHGVLVRDFRFRLRTRLPDVLHIHWPEFHILTPRPQLRAVLKFILFWAYLVLLRLRGRQLVWTAHNEYGHDDAASPANRALWRGFMAMLGGVIFLSHESRRILEAEYPALKSKRSTVIPHGHYRDWAEGVPRKTAFASRVSLGLDDGHGVILYFGVVRRYKNADGLIREFGALAAPQARLVVAGAPGNRDLEAEMTRLCAADSRVVSLLRRLTDAELVDLVDLCDVVVLPYRKILNSGSVLLALSLGKPVVAPRCGSLPELQANVGADWLFLYEGELSPQILAKALNWGRAPRPALSLAEYDWGAIAARTRDFCKDLVKN